VLVTNALSAARDRRKSRKTLIINRINVVEAAGPTSQVDIGWPTVLGLQDYIHACEALDVPNHALFDITWNIDPKRRFIELYDAHF
jgi:hypothetical protein